METKEEMRLEALKLAYEASFKQERDEDNIRYWTNKTPTDVQKKYFEDVLVLADINYKYILSGKTKLGIEHED